MIKLFEAFSGYGSQSMALRDANIPFEVVGISEIDKYAIVAYEAVHGKIKNFGDISKIDEKQLPDFNLFTYSFPCTDISISGKQKGINEGTRSGLLWECERIIEHKKPQFLLMENVKNLIGKKFKPDFDRWCKILESMGYVNHWQVLNAKEHGIPQNRERVFMISILNGDDYKFPEKEELKIFLKDILEDEVDEKYYLKPEQYSNLLKNLKETGKLNTNPSGKGMNGNISTNNISPTLTTNKGEGLKIVVGAAQRGRENGQELELNKSDCLNTITTVQKDSLVAEFNIIQKARGFNMGGIKDMCPPITASSWQENNYLLEGLRVRKLTPLECFRLMNVKDEDFYKIQKALNDTFYKGKDRSSSQLYKLAGNSIVVKPLMKIFKNLYNETKKNCSL